MIVINGERSILIRLFSGRLIPREDGFRVDDLTQIPAAEVSAIYKREDTDQLIPDLLLVETHNPREFYAWCNTYLPYWSPLSAGIQIIERKRLQNEGLQIWRKCPRQLIRGMLCVALGELLFEWQLSHGQTQPNVLSLRSTFGYAATCAVISHQACINDLLSRWTRTQHLLQLPPRRINSNTLKSVWAPIFSIAKPSFEVDQPQVLISKLAGAITQNSPQPSLFRQETSRTNEPQRREQVVIELEHFIRETKLADVADCFEAAAIASRMSSNPLSHFNVLSEMTKAEPRTLLWYAFLSGAFTTEPAPPIFENMLFRVESELRDQAGPKSDIALDELEALIGPHGQVPERIGVGARFVNVELDYGVCASFRLRRDIPQSHSQTPPVDDRQLVDELLEQLRIVFDRNTRIQQESVRQSKTKKTRKRRG